MGANLPDLRLCFAGDSFTQGVGDPDGVGWVGRVAASTRGRGFDLTAYNLGVRMDTSGDVADRWYGEAAHRLRHGDVRAMVFSFGVNDMTGAGRTTRVPFERSLANLDAILDTARGAGWAAFVVGQAAVRGEGRGDQAALEDAYAKTCATRGVPFVPLYRELDADPRWWASVERFGDDAHCDAAGYAIVADLVLRGGWWDWLASLTE